MPLNRGRAILMRLILRVGERALGYWQRFVQGGSVLY